MRLEHKLTESGKHNAELIKARVSWRSSFKLILSCDRGQFRIA